MDILEIVGNVENIRKLKYGKCQKCGDIRKKLRIGKCGGNVKDVKYAENNVKN